MNHLWMANHVEKRQYELLLKTKLRNRILKIWPQGIYYLQFQLKNVRINGNSLGCTGFIRNSITDNIVYVNTEPFMFTGYLRRYAKSMTDYTGEFNQYSKNADQFALDVVSMLKREHGSRLVG